VAHNFRIGDNTSRTGVPKPKGILSRYHLIQLLSDRNIAELTARTRSATESEQSHITAWPIYQALLLGFLCAVVALVVSFVMTASVPRHKLTLEFVPIETIVMCAATLCAGWLFLKLTRRSTVPGFLESISWCHSTRSFFLWLGVGTCVGLLIQHLTSSGVGLPFPSPWFFLYSLFGTVLLQPLIEEIYFRGILFESLSQRFGYLYAITIVSVVFLLAHGLHRWILIPITLLLALARISTRSTSNCFALHASYNFTTVLAYLVFSHRS
jgi:membrane protease YdiL (CAAX protease family)